jgi:hypothetical protein
MPPVPRAEPALDTTLIILILLQIEIENVKGAHTVSLQSSNFLYNLDGLGVWISSWIFVI